MKLAVYKAPINNHIGDVNTNCVAEKLLRMCDSNDRLPTTNNQYISDMNTFIYMLRLTDCDVVLSAIVIVIAPFLLLF